MGALRQREEMDYIRSAVVLRFPLLGAIMAGVEIYSTDEYPIMTRSGPLKTAATDGKDIFYSPEYFATLSDEEKIFVIAHEVLHIAFNHIMRSGDRDDELWNEAGDAVINQILKSEHLPMPEGGIDIAEALYRSTEEMYEKLKKDPSARPRPKDGGEGEGKGNHDLWKEAVEKAMKEGQGKPKKMPMPAPGAEPGKPQEGPPHGEKNFAQANRQERSEQASRAKSEMNRDKDKAMAGLAPKPASLGAVGEADAVLDWTKVLKKTLDVDRAKWSYRRSSEDNDFMARAEELDEEDQSVTEVRLDVSGSVNVPLLKEFLRQLKPILKESKLKVGCFDEHVYDWVEIKNSEDIDNFKIVATSQWTENWDAAVKSFSKKKEVNKIVFTDGKPQPGNMPDETTKGINVIWLVYGSRNFKPICGKVINVDPAKIKQKFVGAPEVVKARLARSA